MNNHKNLMMLVVIGLLAAFTLLVLIETGVSWAIAGYFAFWAAVGLAALGVMVLDWRKQ